MTYNSLTENEEYNIPSQILKIIFGLHASVIFRPQYVWFPVHFRVIWSHSPPKLWWSIGGTNCLYYSNRVDLYSHKIILIALCRYRTVFVQSYVLPYICLYFRPVKTNFHRKKSPFVYKNLKRAFAVNSHSYFHNPISRKLAWVPHSVPCHSQKTGGSQSRDTNIRGPSLIWVRNENLSR